MLSDSDSKKTKTTNLKRRQEQDLPQVEKEANQYRRYDRNCRMLKSSSADRAFTSIASGLLEHFDPS